MGKSLILLTALLISSLFSGASLLASGQSMSDKVIMQKKDVCILYSMNCTDNAYQVQQRIKALRGEIMRGYTVYSEEELHILIRKLDEAKQTLLFLMKEGA